MADADSTTRNEASRAELAEQFPCNSDPFGVWYLLDETTGIGYWSANDKKGRAIGMAANRKDALKIAEGFRYAAYEKAIRKAEALRASIPGQRPPQGSAQPVDTSALGAKN